MTARNRLFSLTAPLIALIAALLLPAGASAAPALEVSLDADNHELQRVEANPNTTSGQFRLNFGSGGPGVSETADIPYDADAAEVQAALNALENVSAGGGSVSVFRSLPGVYGVTFDGGPLAHTDVPELTVSPGTVPLNEDGGVMVFTLRGPEVRRGDEQVGYSAKVTNLAKPEAGDQLSCSTSGFSTAGSPTFAFQWLRDGDPIGSATASTYTLAEADEGAVVQCMVTATNTVPDATEAATFAGSTRVATGVVVDPAPGTPAPSIAAIATPVASGALDGAEERELTCKAGSWSGSPDTYAYRWYRNGAPFGAPVAPSAATEDTLSLQAAEQSPPAAFQCAVTAANASGAFTRVSGNLATSPAPSPAAPNNNTAQFVSTTGDSTSGTVTLEVELPGGSETYAHKTSGSGWSCSKLPPSGPDPARAICTRSSVLAPGASYPTLGVTAALGADTADPAIATATVGGGGSAPAEASYQFDLAPALPFGIRVFDAAIEDAAANPYTQAGGHPYRAKATFRFNLKRNLTGNANNNQADFFPVEQARNIIVDVPRGVVGNPRALAELCPSIAAMLNGACPAASAVGGIDLRFSGLSLQGLPIYAIEPEFGQPAQFAFRDALNHPFTFAPELRADDGYAISFVSAANPAVEILAAEPQICDFGAKLKSNDFGIGFDRCKRADEPDANPLPLVSNPTRCDLPEPPAVLRADSWENPGVYASKAFPNPTFTGCEKVRFEPDIDQAPTSDRADSPTGLEVELTMPTNGLEGRDDEGNPDPEAISQASLKTAEVTFPEGMAVNPSAGHGLGACSAEQVKLETNLPISCPDASKIGTVEIETPILEDTLEGAIYIAKQGDVDGSLIGMYMVFDSPENGLLIKIPGQVEADPETGQLVATFDGSPEQPFSAVRLRFPGGPRATLLTPPKCGTYGIEAKLSPWTGGKAVEQSSEFEVDSGPNGGPCPKGNLEPKLSAGVTNPLAGQTSPFVLRLSREDGSDRFTALSMKAPRGLAAYLKGVPYCPDTVLASISTEEGTGQDEIDDPSCPGASQVGRVIAGAGAGDKPFYVDTGRAYLAGPYKGAPLSIAVVAPAVAGPLDLGNVVVRNAVYFDPQTAEVTVVSDPVPHILHGLLLDIRDVRVLIDRPGFTLNPSGCDAKQVGADVKGLATGAIVSAANHFQVGNCAALGFKPRVALRLFGGTKRGAYQGVRAVVRPRPGDSNISRTVVRFPRSAFVAQEHIRTVCTRVQFKADACPKGSIYGKAVAWSPLLDYPLRGNVYLRSSDNDLPDAVADLRGPAHQPVRVEVAVRNDSVGGALRNTVQTVPDAPVSYFRLQLFGKGKGLIINSRNICVGDNKATVVLGAHNGARRVLRPRALNPKCVKAKRKGKRRAARRKRGSGHASP